MNEAKIETERCTLKNINSVEYKLRYSNETAFKSRKALNTNFYWEFDPGSGRTLAVCLTHASRTRRDGMILRENEILESGERVSNAWVTCPMERNSLGKLGVMPYNIVKSHGFAIKRSGAIGWTRVPLASWWDNSPPRRRWVTGLRGRTVTLELRHGPDSYGRQQWGILRNGGNPDAAIPREWRRFSDRKALLLGKKKDGTQEESPG